MIIHNQKDAKALKFVTEALQTPNHSTQIVAHDTPIRIEDLHNYKAVLCISVSFDYAVKASNFCHSRGVSFLFVDIQGIFVNLFCDFYGLYDEFIEKETQFFSKKVVQIESISNTNPAIVVTKEDITFDESQPITLTQTGIPQLNDTKFSFEFEKQRGSQIFPRNKVIVPFDASLLSSAAAPEAGKVVPVAPQRSKSLYLSMDGFLQLKKPRVAHPQFHQLHLGFQALYKLKKTLEGAEIEKNAKREEFWEIVHDLNQDERFQVKQVHAELLQFLFESTQSKEQLDFRIGNLIAKRIAVIFQNYMSFHETEQWSYFNLAQNLVSELLNQTYPRHSSNLNITASQAFSKTFQDHLIFQINEANQNVNLLAEILEAIPACAVSKQATVLDFRYVPEGYEDQTALVDRLNQQLFFDLSQIFDPQSLALEWKLQPDSNQKVIVILTFRPLFSTMPISPENVNSLGLLIKQFIENSETSLNLAPTFRKAIENIPFLFNENVNNFVGIGAVRYIPEYFASQPEEDVQQGVNQLNQLLADSLSRNDSIFFPGKTISGDACVCIGMAAFPVGKEEILQLAREINTTATQIELESKKGNLNELIQQGIQAAQQSLDKADEERLEQESLVRKLPVVGSFVSWWNGPVDRVPLKGQTFNIATQAPPESNSSKKVSGNTAYSPLRLPPEAKE